MKQNTPYFRHLVFMLLVFMGIASLACMGCGPERLSKNYGRSYESMANAQAVHPDGLPANTPPCELSGPAAQIIYDSYYDDLSEDSSDSDSNDSSSDED